MGFSDLEVVMKSLLNDGKYADMTISCQEHDFKCHRAIICPQSDFFAAALKKWIQSKWDSAYSTPLTVLVVFLTDRIRKRTHPKSTYLLMMLIP